MRFLIPISLLILLSACGSAYKHLQKSNGSAACIPGLAPQITTTLYRAQIDVTGHYLSGLLIIKQLPDSSVRLLFTNEAGFKFFDFGFPPSGNMIVHHITDKMNKKAVIKTLRKDFQLLLMNRLDEATYLSKTDGTHPYHIYKQGKDHYYYKTTANCDSLLSMERGSKRKKIVDIQFTGLQKSLPDSVFIKHNNFAFNITLKQINNYAE
jgi:hypothetical protein